MSDQLTSPRSRIHHTPVSSPHQLQNHNSDTSAETGSTDDGSSDDDGDEEQYAFGYDDSGNPRPMRELLKARKRHGGVFDKYFFKRRVRSLRKSIRSWWALVAICVLLLLFWSSFGGYHASEYDLQLSKPNEFLHKEGILISDSNIESSYDKPFQLGCRVPNTNGPRASAAFVMLARNSEIDDVVKSIKSMERHFNQWFNYPWVFLNDQPFTEQFKQTVARYTSADVEFGDIPAEKWEFDESIDKTEFYEFIESQGDRKIMYGNLESYHKMCRFYSGFFYKHPLVKKRDWYWRVEPDVEFFCDLTYDPFIEMEQNNKKYGFNVLIEELYYTIPGLFKETRNFLRKYEYKVKDIWKLFVDDFVFVKGQNAADYDGVNTRKQALQKIQSNIYIKKILETTKKSDDWLSQLPSDLLNDLFDKAKDKPNTYLDRFDGEEYNMCHFWSNFEIARTDLFNSITYQKYFGHLERSGGFYKERWGDAPIHSLGVAMMLPKEQIHYFRDIGYKHSTLGHCPNNSPRNQLAYEPASEAYREDGRGLFRIFGSGRQPDDPKKNGVGCRCRCPMNMKEIENSGSSCIRKWAEITSDEYSDIQPLNLDYWEGELEKRINEHMATGGDLGEDVVANILKKNE